jgi:hypothetical protein
MVDSPALRVLPARRLQQARQALRATLSGAALAGARAAIATTQQLTAPWAALAVKVVVVVAVAG